jgi:hypothetical protein
MSTRDRKGYYSIISDQTTINQPVEEKNTTIEARHIFNSKRSSEQSHIDPISALKV